MCSLSIATGRSIKVPTLRGGYGFAVSALILPIKPQRGGGEEASARRF